MFAMFVDMKEILLVEDNPSDAKLTQIALKECKLPNSIVHLEDGVDALNYIFGKEKYSNRNVAETPVVILLDLKMPRVDGIEVLEKLKSDERTKHIPVTVFTSSQEHPDVEKCYALGVNSYVVKPVDFDEFCKVVKDLGQYWGGVNLPQ
jgi:two-component system response regulator